METSISKGVSSKGAAAFAFHALKSSKQSNQFEDKQIFDPVQNPDDYPKDEIKHSLICQLDFWITSLKRVRFHLKHLEK